MSENAEILEKFVFDLVEHGILGRDRGLDTLGTDFDDGFDFKSAFERSIPPQVP